MSVHPTLLRLHPGQMHDFLLVCGQRLVVLHGSVTLTLPAAWMSDTLLWPRLQLHTGETHRVDRAGWLRLEADQAPADVVALLPEPRSAIGWLRSFGASKPKHETVAR